MNGMVGWWNHGSGCEIRPAQRALAVCYCKEVGVGSLSLLSCCVGEA